MKNQLLSLIILVKLTLKNFTKLNSIFKEEFILVTASDKLHFSYLNNLIKNYKTKKGIFKKLIIYDLGLTSNQIEFLKNLNNVDLRVFPFESYPEHFQKRIEDHKYKIGGFAWKPVIIQMLCKEYGKNIIWFDSANLFNKKIIFFKIFLFEYGFASFYSSGTISDWTHKNVISNLNLNNDNRILKSRNLMGGVVGINPNNKKAMLLLSNWLELSMVETNIFPKGSSFENHRHDQSLLSICYYKIYNHPLPYETKFFGIKVQNWHDKLIFFYDEKNNFRKQLLNKFSFFSTTTDTRSKIIILFNVKSLKEIPFKLFFNKYILLFITDEDELKNLKNFKLKSKFAYLFINRKSVLNDNFKSNKIKIIAFDIVEIEKIIEFYFNMLVHE